MAIEALELLGASFANDNVQYDIGKHFINMYATVQILFSNT